MSTPKFAGKDRNLAIILAVLFGSFGIHKFYLGEVKKGLAYFLFSWTTIPFFIAFYDAFKYYSSAGAFGSSSSDVTTSTTEGRTSETTEKTKIAHSEPSDGTIMSVEGANGRVTVYNDRLEISRDDIGMLHKMQHGFKGDKEIPFESVTSIQLRKPSSVTRGYIQFGQSGFSESDDGLMDATSDENTVLFDKGSLSEFEELRTKVRELKKGDVQESTGSIDSAMEKLRERYADGEIDESEYEQRKEILQKD
ncbi:NINE protein [Haloarculaceae archaeon H-GB2-1]|nr:NINE protein [Haloarculaceae archaeon H-GB1-1]MEA5408310.1 NINE protein [Haloarculaceae archaeon H-GB2-1]